MSMTVALEGTRSDVLKAQQNRGRAAVLAAIAHAEALFATYPEGVSERELILRLRAEGVYRRIAAAAVDHLGASGKASVNFKTGYLTPTSPAS